LWHGIQYSFVRIFIGIESAFVRNYAETMKRARNQREKGGDGKWNEENKKRKKGG
jgi:hypothetical protein